MAVFNKIPGFIFNQRSGIENSLCFSNFIQKIVKPFYVAEIRIFFENGMPESEMPAPTNKKS